MATPVTPNVDDPDLVIKPAIAGMIISPRSRLIMLNHLSARHEGHPGSYLEIRVRASPFVTDGFFDSSFLYLALL